MNFVDGSFVISSGTTGDGSSIAIRNVLTLDANGNADTANATGEQLFGLSVVAGTPESENTVRVAEGSRLSPTGLLFAGKRPPLAIVQGNQMGIDPRSLLR